MGKTKVIRLDLNETQANILRDALEEYFRIRMGQFDRLTEDLAFYNYNSQADKKDTFNEAMIKKEALKEIFYQVRDITWPGTHYPEKTIPEALVASDIWSVLRHELFKTSPDLNPGIILASGPIQIGSEPLPKVSTISHEAPARLTPRQQNHAKKSTSSEFTFPADIPLEDLNISVRTYNRLKRRGLSTVGEVSKLTCTQLKNIQGIGKTAYDEIIQEMKRLGYEIKK